MLRLLVYGAATFTYTANGELATKTDGSGTTAYNIDEMGNLLSVTLPAGTEIDYLIDGQNRRIAKTVAGTMARQWIWSGPLRIAAELDGTGALISRFVYATHTNVPDYMIRGNVTYRLITDHLGSVRLVVDASTGTVVQRLDYDEFGRVLGDSNPGFQPFGFAGGLYDQDTGLVRFGARDYDPQAGRWTSKDPLRFAGSGTDLYEYATSDPINSIDIIGLASGDPYPTRDAAATAAIGDVCGESRTIQREFGGYIYRRPDNLFSYTPPLHGFKSDMRNLGSPSQELPRGIVAVGSYHTHGDYDDTGINDPMVFSPGDKLLSHRYSIPAYLGTPSGAILRYDPYPDSSGGFERQVSGCDCRYRRASEPELWLVTSNCGRNCSTLLRLRRRSLIHVSRPAYKMPFRA